MAISAKVVIQRMFEAEKVRLDVKNFIPRLYLIKVNGEYAGKVIKN